MKSKTKPKPAIESCANCKKRFIAGHHGITDIHGRQFCTPLCIAKYYNRITPVKE